MRRRDLLRMMAVAGGAVTIGCEVAEALGPIAEVTGEETKALERFPPKEVAPFQEFGTILEDIDWAEIMDVLMIADPNGGLLVHYDGDMLFPGGSTGGLAFPLCGDWDEVKIVEISFPQFGKRFTARDLEKVAVKIDEIRYLSPIWGWGKALSSSRMWMRRHLIYYVSDAARREGERWYMPLHLDRFFGEQLRTCWRLILPIGAKLEEVKPEPVAKELVGGCPMIVWEWQKPIQPVLLSVRWKPPERPSW